MTHTQWKAFERVLVGLRDRLGHEIIRLVDGIPQSVNAPGQPSNLPTHFADAAADGIDTDVALLENDEAMREAVDAALERIRKGTFGICEGCGQEIAAARLEAIPYTAYCIRCARIAAGEGRT